MHVKSIAITFLAYAAAVYAVSCSGDFCGKTDCRKQPGEPSCINITGGCTCLLP
ncbi:hypothetical protein CGMCC3_g11166 [Colletotrichum fructicola]|uniref:Uncharacterized protein n=1 Tax=Colletotrichum chrysophilum TaxID=1836956 RepID=A0AAD9AU49_9PEZI|nr:uncharacterized protein CGMCC3_g11166 [Colletotrichum fructicola]KAE9572752.1 hypothetical protein CGMCC3_g11166 [Colletotrichum fructicola]KAK1853524.1 hypothetical protein CCHR01_03841 [Colletotrichum chrysophilum]